MSTVTEVNMQQYVPTASPTEEKPSVPVSVFNETPNASSEGSVENSPQETQKSKIDELLEKLCKELAKYNLKPEDLKENHLIEKISGLNELQIQNAKEDVLNRIYECLKAAIVDSIQNGQVNYEKAVKLGINYNTALVGDWSSIESFKKAQNKNQESLSARMERFFGLQAGSFASLPKEKIEEYLERYFNQWFLDKVKRSSNPEQEYKKQLQDFSKLLVNTPDEQKDIFREAIKSLAASNRVKGIEAVLRSFETQEARTKWADGCDAEYIEEIATKPDAEGNVPDSKEVTKSVAEITKNKSEDAIKRDHDKFIEDAKAFFEENKEALITIQEKFDRHEPLTREEWHLLHRRDVFLGILAGEMSGTAINEVVPEEIRDVILRRMNEDDYRLPGYPGMEPYKRILEKINEFNANNNGPLTPEQIRAILDSATNGNLSEVASGSDNPKIVAPDEVREVATAEDLCGVGYYLGDAPVVINPQNTLLELYKQNEEPKPDFYVESQNPEPQPQTRTSSNVTSPATQRTITPQYDTKGLDWICEYDTTGAKSFAEVVRKNFDKFTTAHKVELYEMASKEKSIADVVSYGLPFLIGFSSYHLLSKEEKEQLRQAGVSGIVLASIETEEQSQKETV